MSKYYGNYNQYLGSQKCCNIERRGPQGMIGPTGPASVGPRGNTGPTGPQASNFNSIIGGVAQINEEPVTYISYMGLYVAGKSLEVEQAEIAALNVIPFNCKISNLYINLSATPGESRSYTFTLRNNSINTDITITISDNDTSGNDLVHSATFNSGDSISIMIVPDGSPNSVNLRWTCQLSSL